MKNQMTIAEALNKAHHQLMEMDSHVVVIGEDIVGGTGLDPAQSANELGGVFGVTGGLAARFGTARVIDTPISETAFVGMGVGASMTGLKPIVEIMFCDFIGVCFDQILNQAAKVRFLSGDRIPMPLVVRTTMGAGDGSGAMHSQSLHGLLASIPGLQVACPATPADAAGLLKSALLCPDPVVLFEHKALYGAKGDVEPGLPPVKLGRGRLVREGADMTIVAVSAMVSEAEKAAAILAEEGIMIDLIDPRTIQPLDSNLILSSLKKTGRLLVVDEGAEFAGFADAVIAVASINAFASLKAAPAKITPPHVPVPYGRALEARWLPSATDIVLQVREMLHGS